MDKHEHRREYFERLNREFRAKGYQDPDRGERHDPPLIISSQIKRLCKE